jgi:DNA-binding CsgD family transcriptional regulator/tetratricopeptide (TPR) repeat protein
MSAGGQIVFVEGAPGIGKTRLLDALATEALANGFGVRAGRAEELQLERPFGAIVDALGLKRAPGARLARVAALLSDAVRAPDYGPVPAIRGQVLDEVVEILSAETSKRPVLLVLDDLQWADASTLMAVAALVRELRESRLLIAVAYRPIPRRPDLQRLVGAMRDQAAAHIRVGPLASDDVVELTRGLTGQRPGPRLVEQAVQAGGNPLYLTELVRALQAENRLAATGDLVELSDADFPTSLTAAVIRRLAFLPESTLETLRWAAVLGSSFSVRDIAVVIDKPVAEILAALQPAIDSSIVTDRGDRLGFGHDLVHDVVYRDVPGGVRAAMHVETARRLVAAGAAAIDVAPHYARGAVGRDAEAADWLARAGREVAPRAPQAAVDLFRKSLALSDPADPIRRQLTIDLVRALLWAGLWAEAEQLTRDALRGERDARAFAELTYTLGRSLVYRGRTTESIAEVENALRSATLAPDDRANLLADLTMRLPLAGELDRAEAAGSEVLESAAEGSLARRTALSGLALTAVLRGDPRGALRLAEAAVQPEHARVGEAVELIQPDFFHSIALVSADQLDESLRVLGRLRERAERVGLMWGSGLAALLIGHVRFLRGDWDDAVVELRLGLALGAESGTAVWSVLAHALLLTIAARRGDRTAAVAAQTEGERMIAAAGTAHLGYERWMLADALYGSGSATHDSQLSALASAWSEMSKRSFVAARQVLGPPLARLASQARSEEQLATVASDISVLAATGNPPSYLAAALVADALAGRRPELARDAADAFMSVGRQVEALEAAEDLGGLLVATGAPSVAARDALLEALAGYERLGAAQDIGRVEQSLRATGFRRGVVGTRSRPTTGWRSLTDTERHVIALVAEGLTNKQIAERLYISHRTVASHVSNVFAKVSLSSRVELAAAVAGGVLETA